jgi:DNA-directed RNA polymerase subunit RPC12/RpoP
VTAVSAVQDKLLDANSAALVAQGEQSKLLAENMELKKKLAEVEDWNRRISRFRLHEFETGTLAFALREDMAEGEPMHYICATCRDRGHITRLQPNVHGNQLSCHPCNQTIQIKPKKPLPTTSTGGSGSWMSM